MLLHCKDIWIYYDKSIKWLRDFLILFKLISFYHYDMTLQIMGCMHTLNAVFLLVDTFLNNLVMCKSIMCLLLCFHMHASLNYISFQKFPWFRMAYFVLWSCIYVIFQWILHACGFTWWGYPSSHWCVIKHEWIYC